MSTEYVTCYIIVGTQTPELIYEHRICNLLHEQIVIGRKNTFNLP